MSGKIGIVFQFNVTGDHAFSLFVDFTKEEPEFLDAHPNPNYVFTVDAKYLHQVLTGKIYFDDFVLTMKFKLWRNPDQYNWPMFSLLRFGFSRAVMKIIEDAALRVESETVIVESDGKTYEIQRYCPHAGKDLKCASIAGGKITCARHGWTFDLDTGNCLSGGNMLLKTRQVQNGNPMNRCRK